MSRLFLLIVILIIKNNSDIKSLNAIMKKFFLLIIVCFAYSSLYSQGPGDVRINNVRNLVFNNLLPGITSTVATNVSNAGRIEVDIRKNLTLAVTFTLPTNLTSGSNNLPVTFTATKSTNSNDVVLGTTFDPYSGTTIRRNNPSTRYWYLRIGGTIQTPTNQQGGNYSGSLIVTLSFIGN